MQGGCGYKNQTNHPILSNSHPSATSNKAIHCLKLGGEGTQPMGTSYNFDKVWSGAPDERFGKLFLIRDANTFDKSQNSIYFKLHFTGKFTQVIPKRTTITYFQKWFHFKTNKPGKNINCVQFVYSNDNLNSVCDSIVQLFYSWLRITGEGSIPDMHVWFIMLIQSNLKMVHLSQQKSLFCISTTWWVSPLVDHMLPR